MEKFIGKMKALVKDEEGAAAVEYGILVALIAVAIVVAVTAVGDQLTALFQRVVTELTPV